MFEYACKLGLQGIVSKQGGDGLHAALSHSEASVKWARLNQPSYEKAPARSEMKRPQL
jgi:hypothetical protein